MVGWNGMSFKILPIPCIGNSHSTHSNRCGGWRCPHSQESASFQEESDAPWPKCNSQILFAGTVSCGKQSLPKSAFLPPYHCSRIQGLSHSRVQELSWSCSHVDQWGNLIPGDNESQLLPAFVVGISQVFRGFQGIICRSGSFQVL